MEGAPPLLFIPHNSLSFLAIPRHSLPYILTLYLLLMLLAVIVVLGYTVKHKIQVNYKQVSCAVSCWKQLYDQLCNQVIMVHQQQSTETCPVPY